nr:MAG TPA: hypothetical protein [Caudoviricetes sp.]
MTVYDGCLSSRLSGMEAMYKLLSRNFLERRLIHNYFSKYSCYLWYFKFDLSNYKRHNSDYKEKVSRLLQQIGSL